MFDEKRGRNIFMDDANFPQEKHEPHWWDDAEPLWVTAEKQGKKTYFYYWRECDVAIRGVKPTFCLHRPKVSQIPEMQYSIQESLNLFQNGSADFVGIYIEAVDHYGHRYGVGSKELKDMIKKVDDEIYNLIKQMTSLGLDDVSLMVFSDHGMANIQETVDLFKTLDMDDVTALIPEGSTVKIWPKPGLIDKGLIWGRMTTYSSFTSLNHFFISFGLAFRNFLSAGPKSHKCHYWEALLIRFARTLFAIYTTLSKKSPRTVK